MFCTIPCPIVKGMLIFSQNRRLGAKMELPDHTMHQNVKQKLSVTAGAQKGPIDCIYTPLCLGDIHERSGSDMSPPDGGAPGAQHAWQRKKHVEKRAKSKLPVR